MLAITMGSNRVEAPSRSPVSFANDIKTIIERARIIMRVSDEERDVRLAVHALYKLGQLERESLRPATDLSHRAMVARIAGRQMLTGNHLISYPLHPEDVIVGPGMGRNVLFGAHYKVGPQAGKLAIGNEIHFATNGPRGEEYDTLAYLAITAPENDQPTRLHVGIPWERLDNMQAIGREQAIGQVQATGQIIVPQSDPVFFL